MARKLSTYITEILLKRTWNKQIWKFLLCGSDIVLQLKQQYGDKYAEWMAETEKKINELQETNQLL